MTRAPDMIDALRRYLLADPDVSELVGTRVFGGELPSGQASSMPRHAVVIRYSGGGSLGGGHQEYSDKRVDVRCYGSTIYEADRLWRSVGPALQALQREVHADCLLHWARRGGGPIDLRDPDTDWPFIFSSWQVLSSDRVAA